MNTTSIRRWRGNLTCHSARRGSLFRRGWTLLEALVATALASTLMTIGAVTIQATFKVERRAQELREGAHVWRRLATDFRRDAARAEEATLGAGEDGLANCVLQQRGIVTRYTATKQGLRRTSRSQDGRPNVEDYAVARGGGSTVQFRSENGLLALELKWSSTSDGSSGAKRQQIVTSIGRDLRFERGN